MSDLERRYIEALVQQAEDLGYPPQQYTWNAEAKRRKVAA